MSPNEICHKSTSYCLALLQSARNSALTCKQANSAHYLCSVYLKWITHKEIKPALRAVSVVPHTERTADPWISLSTEIRYCDILCQVVRRRRHRHCSHTANPQSIQFYIICCSSNVDFSYINTKYSSKFSASTNYIGTWSAISYKHEIDDGIETPAIKKIRWIVGECRALVSLPSIPIQIRADFLLDQSASIF